MSWVYVHTKDYRGMVRVSCLRGLVPAVVIVAMLFLTLVNFWKIFSKTDNMAGKHGNYFLPANYSMQNNDIMKRLERMELHINKLGKAKFC